MYISYTAFNWLFLIPNVLWIIGIAIALACFSYIEFNSQRFGQRRRDYLVKWGIRAWLFASLAMTIAGYAISPNESDLGKKAFGFIDLKRYKESEILPLRISEEVHILNRDVEMFIGTKEEESNRYPVNDATITMPWNGGIGTPFFAVEKGGYSVEFEAQGSEAGGEFAKVLVYFAVLENDKLTLKKLLSNLELTDKKSPYKYSFQAESARVGKIRIQFYNDGGDEKGGDRNVFIGNIKLKRTASE